MADLIITAITDFGPLSVEVVAVGGERSERRPVLLSSARPEATIRGLDPGEYAVIATRPTGERLVEPIHLDQPTSRVQFAPKGRSPHEFLHQEASRGLVPSVPLDLPQDEATSTKELSKLDLEGRFGAGGTTKRSFDALAARHLRAELAHLRPGSGIAEPRQPDTDDASPRRLTLCQWILMDQRWEPVEQRVDYKIQPDYLQLFVEASSSPSTPVHAFALLDETDFGPVVIAPLFQQGLTITFLAGGLVAEDAAERVANPSGVRVPVAVAIPHESGLADLLSGLSAASLPGAEQLWANEVEQHFGGADQALDVLLHKYEDPAAAVLGAHFLSRFSPRRVPVRWLENLAHLLPDVSDAATLLAWRMIAEGSSEEHPISGIDIQSMLRDAQSRPCTMFARTRTLLTQAVRLYGPKPRGRGVARRTPPKWFRPGDFLNVAADAGGLEAFWGASPQHPGRPHRPRHFPQMWQSSEIDFVGGAFNEVIIIP